MVSQVLPPVVGLFLCGIIFLSGFLLGVRHHARHFEAVEYRRLLLPRVVMFAQKLGAVLSVLLCGILFVLGYLLGNHYQPVGN
jgi:hypothetical protein